jgi:hypothetical protein
MSKTIWLLILVLLGSLRAQLDITWKSCAMLSYTHSFQLDGDLGPVVANCGKTTVRYNHNDLNSFNITLNIKRYPAQASSLGTVFVIGDTVVVCFLILHNINTCRAIVVMQLSK